MSDNTAMKKIGILIERQRGYGRRLCEGVVRFACERNDWSLKFIEFSELRQDIRRNKYDGFIARVMNDGIAKAIASVGKPVVDVFVEKSVPGFAAADHNALVVGQMAARHFIEHHFDNFAFCGYNGRSYSDGRRHGFVRSLELNHFKCSVYSTPRIALKDFEDSVVMHERFGMPSDAVRLLKWLRGLPKPVAIFCAHDMRAYQVSEICRANGISVPGDVAILGVDNDELCACSWILNLLENVVFPEDDGPAPRRTGGQQDLSGPPEDVRRTGRCTAAGPRQAAETGRARVHAHLSALPAVALGRPCVHKSQHNEKHNGRRRLRSCRQVAHARGQGFPAATGHLRPERDIQNEACRGEAAREDDVDAAQEHRKSLRIFDAAILQHIVREGVRV